MQTKIKGTNICMKIKARESIMFETDNRFLGKNINKLIFLYKFVEIIFSKKSKLCLNCIIINLNIYIFFHSEIVSILR